ncbi:DUF4231 domain-containing protein [Sphingobacterium sp. UGAL515B_05]|uniref:DUF4231 domain-containing protein n=1 Tax=Sphingobacterium sp. UGAL515B_05 TaxID=2986767 RepID=UPI0029558484|nr:DUF4231 domain-containing protein [Sphingobacterium sp. UGAL515B_05]WON93820.1 DUF4231 domain-containing protein [Sphingobacterium sp. UGAL515B_05]
MIKDTDFPNYFLAGDNASKSAQKYYVRYVRWNLILMSISAAIAIYNYNTEESKRIVYIISGLILMGAFVLSLIIKTKKYEDIWYRGRALAESSKTLAWRFMTKSEYFEGSLTDNIVEQRFTQRLNEIQNEFKDIHANLKAADLRREVITQKMSEVRSLDILKRMEFYLRNRIDNQIDWYSNKADTNKQKYEGWFWAVIVMQFLAIVSIVFLIFYPSSSLNFVGIFTTLSASFFSWLQLKRYQENKEAYNTAVSELNLIKNQAKFITTDDEFSKFVLDSENAMSREHTMWLAQKRT